MNLISISFTLAPPGQNYAAVYAVIELISFEYCHADESQFIVRTPLSESMVELLLSDQVDANDDVLVLGVSSIRTANRRLIWQRGAQSSPRDRLEARRIIWNMRRAALLRRRAAA